MVSAVTFYFLLVCAAFLIGSTILASKVKTSKKYETYPVLFEALNLKNWVSIYLQPILMFKKLLIVSIILFMKHLCF